MPRRRIAPTSNGFIIGLKPISLAMGVSTRTVLRWSQSQGFPLATLPGGLRITSERLIDLWLLSRIPPVPGSPRIERQDNIRA